ncbi:28S ribosomal protein S5, mitochondrial [Modicella reniformis]|uniref:Small ribosomal subunit protein uS5m n=1 Tax=Modicella reniformis TaxID=1440133 RepID=A0A9P6SMZ1_9FUNG|nr:28S ribosomal protein S5, mitochondrial [Modicella reniformis]
MASTRLWLRCLATSAPVPSTLSIKNAIICRTFTNTAVVAVGRKRPAAPVARVPGLDNPGVLHNLAEIHPLLDHYPRLGDQDGNLNLVTAKNWPSNPPLDEMLKGQAEDDVDESSLPHGLTKDDLRKFIRRALVIKRTSNMTTAGKIPTMYALVVAGNGRGIAGYGEAKDEEPARAVRKATNRAMRNLTVFDRYDDRTIYHDIDHKFHATKIQFRSRPPGFGNRCNHYIHEICSCIGILDISAKVWGSRNPMNVIKATFEAFTQKQKLPDDIARARGKRVVDVQHTYYGASE